MSSTFPPMYALLFFHKNWLEPGQSHHHHHHLSLGLLQLPHNCSSCFRSCPLNAVLIRTTRGSLCGICHITSPSPQTFPMAPRSLSKNQRPSDVLPGTSVSDPQYLSTVSSSISIFISFPPILDGRLVFCFFLPDAFLPQIYSWFTSSLHSGLIPNVNSSERSIFSHLYKIILLLTLYIPYTLFHVLHNT